MGPRWCTSACPDAIEGCISCAVAGNQDSTANLRLDSLAAMGEAEPVGQILAIAREVLSSPGITADDELADHGGTSLSIVRIIAMTSRMLSVDINPRDLGGIVTVRGLARIASRQRGSP